MKKYFPFLFAIVLLACSQPGEFSPGRYVSTFSRGQDIKDETGFWPAFMAGDALTFEFANETFSVLNSADVSVIQGSWGFTGDKTMFMNYGSGNVSHHEIYTIEYHERGGMFGEYFVLKNTANGFELTLHPEG